MGKFKRDYSDVERRDANEGYAGPEPKPGIYSADLVDAREHTAESSGNEGTRWMFRIVDDEDYEGWNGYVYTNEEGAAWKEVQILEAIGILAPGKDTVNLTHEKIVEKARTCRIKVRNEEYEGEKRGKIGTVLPPKEGGSKRKKKDDDEDEPEF